MQIKLAKINIKTKKTAIKTAIVTLSILFALASNSIGHNIQAAVATSNATANSSSTRSASSFDTSDTTKLVLALRDLWVDHTGWTRNYIISFIAGLPDTNLVAERLLKNQEDIGNAIKPFYGDEATNELTSLLKDHIIGAVELLKAAKAGNTTGAAAAEKKWYENADQIATFLSKANPYWSKEALKNMLDNHLALTKAEAVARLTGNYAADIATTKDIKS